MLGNSLTQAELCLDLFPKPGDNFGVMSELLFYATNILAPGTQRQ